MSAKLQSGSTLGRYELLTQLGRGGMASVWVARERSRASGKERLVAVKAMRSRLANESGFRSMFLEEGQIVRSIEHENVVRVYEVGEDRGILHMAMEWVEGESLRTLIEAANERRPIPPEDAVRIIADVAAGLHAAHELKGWDGELRGVVHCDVSPHNILLGVDGVTKLVDFGVANAVTHTNLAADQTIKGKFGYMSPEQARGKDLDRRADIFALGVVLFELTTGHRLFRGRDKQHTAQLVLSGQIPRPSMLDPEYPASLEAIVMRAMDRNIDARYATAAELSAALEQYLVEQRIMISRAGLGKLVMRVVGDRIERRRELIRQSRRAIDAVAIPGAAGPSPVPAPPQSPVPLPRMSPVPAPRVNLGCAAAPSPADAPLPSFGSDDPDQDESITAVASPGAAAQAAKPEQDDAINGRASPGGVAHLASPGRDVESLPSESGLSHTPTGLTPPVAAGSRQRTVLFAVGTLLGLAAGLVAVAWAVQGPPSGQLDSDVAAGPNAEAVVPNEARGSKPASASPGAGEPEAVDISSLPLEPGDNPSLGIARRLSAEARSPSAEREEEKEEEDERPKEEEKEEEEERKRVSARDDDDPHVRPRPPNAPRPRVPGQGRRPSMPTVEPDFGLDDEPFAPPDNRGNMVH